MRFINLTKGKVAIVDDEDFEKLSRYKWELNDFGKGYAVRKGKKKYGEPRTIQMHREILGLNCDKTQDKIIDHINGDGLDNRKCNLRLANTQKNAFNRDKPKGIFTSKYKGVLKIKNKPGWVARIKFNDRHIELGTYDYEELAAAVYNFASRLMFGEFRRENNVGELSFEIKAAIYFKCIKYIKKYNWFVDTELIKSFQYSLREISYYY